MPADRGFNIMELVGQFKAEVQLPAFTKGKLQLSPKKVKESRELAKNAHTRGEINCDGNAEVQHLEELCLLRSLCLCESL